MSLNKQITINEVLSAISRHRGKALMTFFVLMALIAVFFIALPRKYGSEGRLYVRLGKTGTGLDPTPGGTSISIQDSRETEIRSVVEIVKSRAILDRVVDEVGAEKILEGPFGGIPFEFTMPTMPWTSVDEADKVAREQYDRLRKKELAAKAIEDDLSVIAEKKASVISIYCTANSPTLAQKIVSELMKATMAKHVEVHAVKDSASFFQENLDSKQKELVDAEQKQNRFRNDNEFLSIYGARNTQQNIINKLALEMIDAEANYEQAQKRVNDLNDEMAAISRTIETPKSGVEKLSTEDSRTELFKLQSELRRLEKTLSADHPKLKPLKEAVETLQAEFKEMPGDRIESATLINPVYEKVKVSFVSAKAEMMSYKGRWDNLIKKHAEAVAKLRKLNDLELEANQLERDVNLARQDFEIYLRKRTESAVVEELNKKAISNVVVAQDASMMVKHVSPRGSVLVPLGAIFASFCAVGTALYCEKDLLSGHLSEDELEQILEIPILVSLPTVSTQRNMVG